MLVQLLPSVSGALMTKLTICCCNVSCLLYAGLVALRLRLVLVVTVNYTQHGRIPGSIATGSSGQTPCNRNDDNDQTLYSV